MKRILEGSFLFILVCCLVSCNHKNRNQYTNSFKNIVDSTRDGLEVINAAIKSGEYAKAEEARVEWTSNLDKSIKEAKSIGNFRRDISDFIGNSEFKDDILKILYSYRDLSDDYKKLIELHEVDMHSVDVNKLWHKIENTIGSADSEMVFALDGFRTNLMMN